MVQPEPGVEDDKFMRNVCTECESRANRSFYLTLAIAFILALVVALPLGLLNGNATHAGSITAI